MGEAGVSTHEEGALKVVQHYKLSFSLRRLLPEGFERHRVAKWPNCDCLSKNVREAEFNRLLKSFFVIALSLAVFNVIIVEQLLTPNSRANISTWDYAFDQTWLFGHFQIRWKAIVLLAMFAAVILVGVFARKATKNAGSAPPRRGEAQTITGLVQQV